MSEDAMTALTTVKKLYDAMAAKDLATVLEVLAPDAVINEPDLLPYGGEYLGTEAITGLFGRLVSYYDLDTFKVREMLVDGAKVFSVLQVNELASGRTIVLGELAEVNRGRVGSLEIYLKSTPTFVDS